MTPAYLPVAAGPFAVSRNPTRSGSCETVIPSGAAYRTNRHSITPVGWSYSEISKYT